MIKISKAAKLILWIICGAVFAGAGALGYFVLRESYTWVGIVYTTGYDVHYYKEIGDYNSLLKCREAAELSMKVDPLLPDGKVASEYLCGRGCYVDPMNRDPMLEDYECIEKVKGTR